MNLVADKRVIVIADTSTFTLTDHKNRIKDTSGLIQVAWNHHINYHGLELHTNVVYDRDTHTALGVSHSSFVKRKKETRREKGEKTKRNLEYIEEKESYKWIDGFKQSIQVLNKAAHITLIADRECDMIEALDRLPDDKVDLVLRSHHNRNVIDESGEQRKLRELIGTSAVVGTTKLKVKTKKRKKRRAIMETRIASFTIPWGKCKKTKEKKHPEGIKTYAVEIREKTHKGYKNEPPLVWLLLTTMAVTNMEEAREVVSLYERRWLIEEFFKLLKTDCYNIENTELTRGKSIRKLLLLTMKAAIKIQQLKAARDGTTKDKIDLTFTEDEIECLININKSLEGKTVKQQNPHSKDDLAYAAWIIARLGGWKEFYNKERPPGNKTFVAGLQRFEAIHFGYKIKDVS